MPSGVGKRQYRASILSFCICLTRIIDQVLLQFFVMLFLSLERSLEPKNQNRLLWARKSSIL